MSGEPLVVIDDPLPMVRRFTLNRPQKRNALSNALRADLMAGLEAADRDAAVRVMILRGAGPCFSSGYDLGEDNRGGQPWHTAGGRGQWARHVVEGAFRIWDLGKPVIAAVHGWCLAGGSELMAACDLAYAAEDAQIGYPPVRSMSPPDMQFHPWFAGFRGAMEMMLTGDAVSGADAARLGLVNRALPHADLEPHVLAVAERVARIDPEIQQFNKRSVHRAFEIMGLRAAIRAGTELQALAFTSPAAEAAIADFARGVRGALDRRDGVFGDYRTGGGDGD